jgi:hypothetical protein
MNNLWASMLITLSSTLGGTRLESPSQDAHFKLYLAQGFEVFKEKMIVGYLHQLSCVLVTLTSCGRKLGAQSHQTNVITPHCQAIVWKYSNHKYE